MGVTLVSTEELITDSDAAVELALEERISREGMKS
jgi:hypothetical protein